MFRWSTRPLMIGVIAAVLVTGSGRAKEPEDSIRGDARAFDTRVTLSAQGQTVQELLRDISGAAGVLLRAGDESAWERVSVFVHDRPVREVIAGMPTLLNCRWHSEAGMSGRRTLMRDRAAREHEVQLRGQTLNAAMDRLLRLARYTQAPASDFLRMREALGGTEAPEPLLRSGNLALLSDPGGRAGLELLTTLLPVQRLALVRGERLFLPWEGMNSSQRELAQAVVEALDPLRGPRTGRRADSEWLRRFGVVLFVDTQRVTGTITSYMISDGGPRLRCATLEFSPDPVDLLSVRGTPYVSGRMKQDEAYRDIESSPFPPGSDLQALGSGDWSELLEALSRKLRFPVLSDHFAATPQRVSRGGGPAPRLEGMSLAAGLDGLCRHYNRLWWYQDGALFFRSRKWFIEQLFEVPPPTLQILRRQLERGGQLDTEGISALTALTSRQLQGLNAIAVSAPGSGVPIPDLEGARAAYDYLRVYSLLNPAQQRQALSGRGLPLAAMHQRQQQVFLDILSVAHGQDVLTRKPDIRLRIEQGVSKPRGPARPYPLAVVNFTYADHTPIGARLNLPYPGEAASNRSPPPLRTRNHSPEARFRSSSTALIAISAAGLVLGLGWICGRVQLRRRRRSKSSANPPT